jgi:acylpyruvate hydrolase
MKFITFHSGDALGLAVSTGDNGYVGLTAGEPDYPGDLKSVLARDGLAEAGETLRAVGKPIDLATVRLAPPVVPDKIICVGLNYADHAAESKMPVPLVPTLFSRFASSLVADGEPIRLPRVSPALDYEGELAVIIGKAGRYIPKDAALDHVAGYSAFNDASVRDYQVRTPQWTIGKNFDGTGPFGPALVTPDELPAGASGLAIETRLNGDVMQKSSTDQLIFDVATLIAAVSEALELVPGDVIITGTPAGVGAARDPRVFMKDGDICEVEIAGIGILSNPVKADA